MLVGVEDVDVAGSGEIRLVRDLAGERGMLDERVDSQGLAGLQIEADPDCEPRVAPESLVGLDSGHGGERIASAPMFPVD